MGTTAPEPLNELRAQFPVTRRFSYLNAGTNGPIADRSVEAVRQWVVLEEDEGRGGMPYFRKAIEQVERLRAGYAARLGAAPDDVAITTSTTDGVGRALNSLGLAPGDEILTSDEEHPGVYGPLAAQRQRGVRVRVVPLAEIANEVTAETKLVCVSHVSWRSGEVAPKELADVEPLVLFDGAQGVGAVAVDVKALGADLYAAAGQKWLCGPMGTGMLYASPKARERMTPPSPGYINLEDAGAGLDAVPASVARAFDGATWAPTLFAQSNATLELFDQTGWDRIHTVAHDLAELAVQLLRERGREVLPRGRTTLVTWREPDAERQAERLLERDVVVRTLPGEDLVRASFGGWSNEQDLERLLEALPR
ncbi:MAG TPA: aminotransferase class V-fold PLP-dependent enzyme [Conexibacter sp.]|jgi:L-cysteine/cystine lyase